MDRGGPPVQHFGVLIADIGVFIPIKNNGWLISKNAPQYMPGFALNKRLVQRA